jgi:hypothetical protein
MINLIHNIRNLCEKKNLYQSDSQHREDEFKGSSKKVKIFTYLCVGFIMLTNYGEPHRAQQHLESVTTLGPTEKCEETVTEFQ